jgi:hypothetical protein
MADLPEETSLQPAATFPDEPFACPHCGQMLAASVRVCPSCRKAIDTNDIVTPEVVIPVVEQAPPPSPKEYARFSWGVFFFVLAVLWAASAVSLRFLGIEKTVLLFAALQVACPVWVLYDAHQKGVPKPGRWAVGSFLPVVWIFVFSWYLSRRKTPKAASPFMEGERGRIFLLIMLVALLLGLVLTLIKGPPHPSSGGKTPDTHGTAAPAGKIAALTNSVAAQAPANAPSEASQT